jgi:hypothetical protein
MTSHRFTFLTISALVLALALATGAAQAMTADIDGTTAATTSSVIPNDRGGPLGVGSVESVNAPVPDAFERAAARAIAQGPPPDAFERAAQRGPSVGSSSLAVSGSSYGYGPHGALLGRGPRTDPGVTSTTASADEGLDWQTIGYGGGAIVMALGLIALGALAVGGHRRTPAH